MKHFKTRQQYEAEAVLLGMEYTHLNHVFVKVKEQENLFLYRDYEYYDPDTLERVDVEEVWKRVNANFEVHYARDDKMIDKRPHYRKMENKGWQGRLIR